MSTSDSTNDPWESEMSSEFDRRVRDLHEAPLTLESVKGTAVGIRRKRRAVAAGSVLAAAAVIVPVAVAAATGLGSDRAGEIPAATSTPSATDSATEAPTEAPTDGDRLEPTYVEGDVLHLPDGSVYELPKVTYESAAQLGDRVVAQVRDDQGGLTVDVIEGGEVVDSYTVADGLVVDVDREVAAFITADGSLQTVWSEGQRILAEGYAGWSVRAVDGGPDCDAPATGGSGCRVVLTDQVDARGPLVVDARGTADNPVPGALVISDARDGRYAVTTEIDDLEPSTCGGVHDETTAGLVFETCDFSVDRFSPDGQYAIGLPSYFDGFGPSTVSIIDTATGAEIGTVDTTEEQGLTTVTWVDGDTIAVSMFDFARQEWSLLSLTAGDDEPVVVAGPAPGSDVDNPFGLLGR